MGAMCMFVAMLVMLGLVQAARSFLLMVWRAGAVNEAGFMFAWAGLDALTVTLFLGGVGWLMVVRNGRERSGG